jgi:hypothetical protein
MSILYFQSMEMLTNNWRNTQNGDFNKGRNIFENCIFFHNFLSVSVSTIVILKSYNLLTGQNHNEK